MTKTAVDGKKKQRPNLDQYTVLKTIVQWSQTPFSRAHGTLTPTRLEIREHKEVRVYAKAAKTKQRNKSFHTSPGENDLRSQQQRSQMSVTSWGLISLHKSPAWQVAMLQVWAQQTFALHLAFCHPVLPPQLHFFALYLKASSLYLLFFLLMLYNTSLCSHGVPAVWRWELAPLSKGEQADGVGVVL